jgi:hypothetical protein
MNTPSFRDVEQLSAYLDGQLSEAEMSRLESRLKSEPTLAATLADLRQARSILRRTPKRRSPRNFTLTPKMAGIRPPIPRSVPALGWASAAAMVVFVVLLGTNLFGQLTSTANEPMLSAAPMTSEGYGAGGGPPSATPPSADNSQVLPTPQPFSLAVPEATSPAAPRLAQSPAAASQNKSSQPVNAWLYGWLALAVLLVAAALLIRWINDRAFRRKIGSNHKK